MVNSLQLAHSGQLSSNTKHSNLPRSHNTTTSRPINFHLHVASSRPGHRLGFYLKSNLSPWLKQVSSVGLPMGCEFGMIYVVGSWFGERCSGSKLTYSSLVIFWGLIYVFGCQESAKTTGKKFNLIFFICLMLIFLYKIYDIAFLIAIKYYYYYFIHHMCANCAYHLQYKYFPLVVNSRD